MYDAVWWKHWKFLLEDARESVAVRHVLPLHGGLNTQPRIRMRERVTGKSFFNRVFVLSLRTRSYSSYFTTRDEVSF